MDQLPVDLRSSSIPDFLVGLIGNSPTDRVTDSIIECPVCNTLYRYTYTCGFGENDVELQRIAPNEVGQETDVEKFTRGLSHEVKETRHYSAHCLVDYYLSQGNSEAVQSLLDHEDETVRSSAEAASKYCLIREQLKATP